MNPIQGIPLQHLVLVTWGGLCFWALQDAFYVRLLLQDQELIDLIETNTERQAK